MTEKDKMLKGLMYNPLDQVLSKERYEARLLFQKINSLDENSVKERKSLFDRLLGKTSKFWIEPPFYCDYGYNISLGEKVFMNFNCCILDVAAVKIGSNTMIGPYVQIYTATHPLEVEARISGLEYAKPINIGKNVWIGGNATICPGVTIGDGTVIGAGAVVTKDVEPNTFVGGSPARFIKDIDNS
ncbi:maltose O-acetyltransferase [Flavobacteriaceae bacterium MAR_2010_188]|nr:maltose O-acetyltransferase [Flavobacteriaceae bacterium MAR_2010_188]